MMKIVTHPASLILWAVFILTSCTGPDDSALREAFLDPPKMYRMNQNMHTIPLDESAEDSVLQWYLDNGDWVERVMDGSYRGERLGQSGDGI